MVLAAMSLYCLPLSLIIDNTEVWLVSSCTFFLYSPYAFMKLLNLPVGKLEKSSVLKAVCSGFEETTEPDICLREGLWIFTIPLKNCPWNPGLLLMLHSLFVGWVSFVDIETNECLEHNGGCWLDKATNVSACKVHFYWGKYVTRYLIQIAHVWVHISNLLSFIILGYLPRSCLRMPCCQWCKVCWWWVHPLWRYTHILFLQVLLAPCVPQSLCSDLHLFSNYVNGLAFGSFRPW